MWFILTILCLNSHILCPVHHLPRSDFESRTLGTAHSQGNKEGVGVARGLCEISLWVLILLVRYLFGDCYNPSVVFLKGFLFTRGWWF